MDYSSSFAISAIGMSIERARVDVAALNLANANSAQGGAAGTGYQPLRVIAQAQGFPGAVQSGAGRFEDLVSSSLADTSQLSRMASHVQVTATNAPPRQVYEPGHPLANDRGYVAYPAVDTATEMVSMMSATRAYEANVSAMNTARTLALRALDIGSNA